MLLRIYLSVTFFFAWEFQQINFPLPAYLSVTFFIPPGIPADKFPFIKLFICHFFVLINNSTDKI